MSTSLTRAYRRALQYASTPMFVESLARSNQKREQPLSSRAIWSLAPRFMWNGRKVQTASNYGEHLAIASHIIGMPASVPGVVVECGCFKGGSTVNLSLATALAGRELHVFDSFEGLPVPRDGDAEHVLHLDANLNTYEAGMYSGGLEEVRENVRRYGDLSATRFHKGWFEDTMVDFDVPCVTAFVDVDLISSLETCVMAIWPRLAPGGALFVHEARHQEIAAFFFDENWWTENLGVSAPGLVGAGSGLGLDPEIGGWTSQLGFAIKTHAESYVAIPG